MGTKKVTITLPDEVMEYIKGHVDARGVSAYVTAAVEHKVAMDKLCGLSDFLDEEYGPLTDEELRAADARFDAMDAWHAERRHEGEVDPLAGKAAA
ncbi:hypothetical protein [Streptomyces sp. ISL-94]|uniref:hypothetical protein n=1 Tax=Streptomyces sp. ISL-94 TaxID=2819190 RepID=UPI001BE88E19|nr:hypothetical protein [Streptomyces sp. ISL-94]MBT2477719.1 hypothetical protein [Streptomyces sp. ISL-94]